MSEWDEIAGSEWFTDLPEEGQKTFKAKFDGEQAAQRLLDKEKEKAQKAFDELAQIKTETRKGQLDAAFKEAGVIPGAAAYYPPDAEVDAEKIKAWAEPQGFVQQAAPATGPAPQTPAQPFVQVTTGQPVGGKAQMDMAQWEAYYRANPEDAAAKLSKGEVILPRSPYEIYTEPFVPRGG